MHLVDEPSFFPSQCTVCQNANGRMVDTERSIPWTGDKDWHYYVCERCVTEAARLLEMVSKPDHETVMLTALEYQQTITDLELEIADLQPVRNALDRASKRWDLDPDDEPISRAA